MVEDMYAAAYFQTSLRTKKSSCTNRSGHHRRSCLALDSSWPNTSIPRKYIEKQLFTHSMVFWFFKSNLEGEPHRNNPQHPRWTKEAVSKSPRRKEADLVPCFQHIAITFAHVCKTFASMQGLFAARPWARRWPEAAVSRRMHYQFPSLGGLEISELLECK